MSRHLQSIAPGLLSALLVLAGCSSTDTKATPTETPAWLIERAQEQRVVAIRSPAFHDFQFTDQLAQSGISFVNQIVDDAGKHYKAVHYDHGTGVCAADVDGDGLPDLYFVTQLGTNQLWKNLGGGKFKDITASAGLDAPDAIAVGCSFADIDNDGRPDLFVTTVRHGNRLFRNAGGGKFQDITLQAGVGYSGHSSGAVFFDFDGDGLLDLFVANVGVYTTDAKGKGGYYVGMADAFHGHTHPERAEASILYHNLGGGRFKDVSQEMGLVDKSWSGDATIIDVNDDGFPDLYVANMQGENHLWLNEGGKHFRDATATYFPRTPWGAMGVKSFDFDGDGKPDLLVTDMHSDMFAEIAPGDWAGEGTKSDPSKMPDELFPGGKNQFVFGNALYVSHIEKGAAPFTEQSDRAGVETYWPWGPSVDDLNADGWDDAFITGSMNFPYRYSTNTLLLNEVGKRFIHSEFTLGVEPRANGTQQAWMQLDCGGSDRDSKACTTCNLPNAKELGCSGDAKGKFTVNAPRGSRSSVLVDIDGDGDLDIVTNEFNGPPQLLISDLSARRHLNFLAVRLTGSHSNRKGIGARVTVVLPDHRRVVKVMDGKSGYLSQSDLPLYFGLGDADHAESIEVRWPSRSSQTVQGPIGSGKTVDIVEP
ncbi:MAG: CRTAC1 family protein [bacterium]